MLREARGVTLLELVAVLVVTGTLTGLALPRLMGGVDRWVVGEAREEVVALLYRARVEARRRGEAVVEVETGGGVTLEAPAGEVLAQWTPATSGLDVEVAGNRDVARLSFGPSGTGRLANATIRISRGRATQEVVVSSYGRVRR